MEIEGFVIVRADGQPRTRRGGKGNLMVYRSESVAKNQAVADGDSVVKVTIRLTAEPVFIRRRVIK